MSSFFWRDRNVLFPTYSISKFTRNAIELPLPLQLLQFARSKLDMNRERVTWERRDMHIMLRQGLFMPLRWYPHLRPQERKACLSWIYCPKTVNSSGVIAEARFGRRLAPNYMWDSALQDPRCILGKSQESTMTNRINGSINHSKNEWAFWPQYWSQKIRPVSNTKQVQ